MAWTHMEKCRKWGGTALRSVAANSVGKGEGGGGGDAALVPSHLEVVGNHGAHKMAPKYGPGTAQEATARAAVGGAWRRH